MTLFLSGFAVAFSVIAILVGCVSVAKIQKVERDAKAAISGHTKNIQEIVGWANGVNAKNKTYDEELKTLKEFKEGMTQ